MPAECTARTEVVRKTLALQPAGQVAGKQEKRYRKALRDGKHDCVTFQTPKYATLRAPAH